MDALRLRTEAEQLLAVLVMAREELHAAQRIAVQLPGTELTGMLRCSG